MYINLTPHVINLVRTDGVIDVIPSSATDCRIHCGQLAFRGSTYGVQIIHFDGLSVVANLPSPVDGIGLIVSTLVLELLKSQGSDRTDIFAPSPLMRHNSFVDRRRVVAALRCLNPLK